MLSDIIQTYLHFQWQDEPVFPIFSRVREVQTGCKLCEGWSKVLDFTRKIGFCLRLAVETEKKTLRKWILLILVLLIPITAVLVALRISQTDKPLFGIRQFRDQDSR